MDLKKIEIIEPRPRKRPSSSGCEIVERPNKKPTTVVEYVNIDEDAIKKIYKFRVLFPNGVSLGLKVRDPETELPMEEFVEFVKGEYFRAMRQTESQNTKRRINWKSSEFRFVDAFDNVMGSRINFENFKPNKYHILRVHDGSGEAETYENMWDLTPDTKFLKELPDEYTFETALADLIDNSLQAIWSNGVKERKLISVELADDRILIFDTGPGMDGSDETSIVNWGKIGASLHRSSRGHGIGGKPPYLTPAFGMFGYGGTMASMHLGRRAVVSSKTKKSKKVYTLHLEREALLSSSGSEKTWRTDGGIRHPTEDEIEGSPHRSFTKVEIFEPKKKGLDIVRLQCKLKDIYFPYIQCDEVSKTGRTIMPIEFQVNGTDLAEIQGGEVAITNLHSCNGPEFVIYLHFSRDVLATGSPGEANARLKFVYFPIVEGKENIERILEKLEAEGHGIKENFETFSRVSIRRLGRLLPYARWTWLPFMEPRQKKGDKAQILKRCCPRVKCFIDTDAGFNPTPSKTDLARQHPYTTALKNFGDKPPEKDKDVKLEIFKDGKQVTFLQLEKQYQEWIFQMHGHYDEEIECGEDQPLLVVSPSNKKRLGISSEIVRVHKVIQRKGASWKSGQKIKVLKGACPGCHKNNIYATLECVLLEGFQGDAGGEARLICSPLGLPNEKGCKVALDDGNASIDIRGSLSLPISVIDSGKCLAIEAADWEYQVEKQRQKTPSTIEILSARNCQDLVVDGVLPPTGSVVSAGHIPPKEIVAVVRPASFNSASASKNLDQKYILILKENSEMGLQIKFRPDDKNVKDDLHIYSGYTNHSSHKGFQGLYIFPVGSKFPIIFKKAGVYTFSLSLRGLRFARCERSITVKASPMVGSWAQLCDERSPRLTVSEILYNPPDTTLEAYYPPYAISSYNLRFDMGSIWVGSCFPPFSIACFDIYGNRMPFASVPEVIMKIISEGDVLGIVHKIALDLSSDKLTLKIKDTLIESDGLDKIRPNYEATLVVSPQNELFSVSIPCQVFPGSLQQIMTQPRNLDKQLLPGQAIKELMLEMFDAYGNHVNGGLEVLLKVDGFCFQDHIGSTHKVDQFGCIDLGGLLKVTGGYGKNVSLSVSINGKIVFKKEFQTETRELRAVCEVPKYCMAGSLLENMAFEIINSEGDVDRAIHDDESQGQSHMLAIKSESLDTDDSVRYSFHHGRCTVRAISLPQKEGTVRLLAAHSRYPELHLAIEVQLLQAPKVEPESIQLPHTDGKLVLLKDSFDLKAPKAEHDDVHDRCSDENLLPLQYSSGSKDIEDFVVSILRDLKELEEGIYKYASAVGDLEKALKLLIDRKVALKQEISMLQDKLSGTDAIMERIASKGDSAASVICRLFREIPLQRQHNNLIENTLGVVALLGTVQTNELSSVLAEYLGEDQMLAVVCKSFAAVEALEKCEKNRNADQEHTEESNATKLAQSINGRYVAICLEDTRPYTGELSSDSERKLALPDPTLPSGNIPSGYLGHAVNMISLEFHHLHTTISGHGLRETLFYCLFGELQVYETRENMKMAKACIKHGAVSLDGGIMRGNGVLSLGHREPEICFPVTAPGSQVHSSRESMDMLRQVEEKKAELKETLGEIKKQTKMRRKVVKKFKNKEKEHEKFLDKKGPLLEGMGVRSIMKNSNGSSQQ
ncbi:structural maintenance of chromosomes flexible hinge domain-containing protein GMI1 [Actinidia eriantha]|uniref:structural maintenance of chromosomes flexible hinge domain-containing protein GMI1 n=1 Tax=Actinidia eriantha TaxID=165200 RepID=UPI00258FEC77|nr:structural maintenance of chromosomes flexible hinge domain-containing protein GMI1 [Actinidia eriantha]